MKSTLILVPVFASLGLAQPPPSYNSFNVYPPTQPQVSTTYSSGPDFVAAPLLIECYCYGYYWYWGGVRVGWKKQDFGYYVYPASKIAPLTVGLNGGACHEVVTIFKESYLSPPIFNYGFSPPIPIPGVGTEVVLAWSYNGFPYAVRDQWDGFCDGEETYIRTNYIPGPFPC